MPVLSPDLSYFVACARAGSIGRAAERLGLSQPAVSKAIARLERDVGAALLHRTAQGVQLTDAGRAFLERADAASRAIEDGLQAARDAGQGHAGLLRMGMTHATSHFVLDALFPRLRRERPASVITLQAAFGDELFDALLRQELSLAVSPVPAQVPQGLKCEILFEEGFLLVHSRSHPLAKVRRITPEVLEDCEAAAPGPHEVARQAAEQALREIGRRMPRVVVQSNSLQALLHAVSRCQLITLLPDSVPRQTLPADLMVRQLPLPGLRRRNGVFTGPGYLSPIGERAIELLREHAGARAG